MPINTDYPSSGRSAPKPHPFVNIPQLACCGRVSAPRPLFVNIHHSPRRDTNGDSKLDPPRVLVSLHRPDELV
jgi:hypothetical protein